MSRGILIRNKARWTTRKTGERGRNGKAIQEVLLESMQPEWQRKWIENHPVGETPTPLLGKEGSQQRSLTIETDLPKPPAETLPQPMTGADTAPFMPNNEDQVLTAERRLTESLKRYEIGVRSAFLAEAQRLAGIVEKYDSIEVKSKVKRQKAKTGVQRSTIDDERSTREFVPEVLALCEEARCTDPIVLGIEPGRGKPRSPHTLDAWSKAYETQRLAAFLRKPPKGGTQNDKRKAVISAEAIEWLNANWRKKPSPLKLHQALEREARKHNWRIPSYGWVWRKYNDLPKMVSTAVFQGQKAFTNKYASFLPRDYRDLAALQILCGDHSVRDITVMLPDGQLTRPWLTAWYDLRTGIIWGWHLDLAPSSNTIGLAYVNGVQNFGAQPLSRPDDGFWSCLQTDQGKDYRCKMLAGQTLEFETVDYGKAARIEGGLNVLCTQRQVGFMEEMNLKHLVARGYNGREKVIERVFRNTSDWEQNTFGDEYCGRDAKNKPDAWVKAWHKHKKLLKRFKGNIDWLRSESPFIAFDDYREALAGWIDEYNRTANKRSTLGGQWVVPIEEYHRLYTTRYEISEQALALLLMKSDKRKIGKNGIQMFQSHWYFLHEAMSRFKGEQVEVRWSDGDYSRIWVVLPNSDVVEASLVTPSAIQNPNRHSVEMVKRMEATDRRTIKEARLIEQSHWRGETVEDRVAAQIVDPDDVQPPDEQRMAVNAPKIHNITRFDRPKLAGRGSSVSAEQIENASVIQGMFGEDRPAARIREEWED